MHLPAVFTVWANMYAFKRNCEYNKRLKFLIIWLIVWVPFDLTCRWFGDADVSDVLNLFDSVLAVIFIVPFFCFFSKLG